MEYRTLGRSGLRVSVLSFGAMTFGGTGFFRGVGSTQLKDAQRQIDLCLDIGINLFDTADVYSSGLSEEILGQALGQNRNSVLIATKAFGNMGQGPNDLGLSRHHLVEACEASLRRLGTDRIDLYQVHNFDGVAPLEETLRALDDLIRGGKVRYIGSSNYSGWQTMKAAAVAERHGFTPYVSQQIQYSLLCRDAEHELLPVGIDQGVGALIWGPLAQGYLSGKYRSGYARGSRLNQDRFETLDSPLARRVIEVLDQVIENYPGATVAQAAINYLRRKEGVSSIILGARNEEQLKDNLGAAKWSMRDEDVRRLDEASARPLPYPYSHHAAFGRGRIRPVGLVPIPVEQVS